MNTTEKQKKEEQERQFQKIRDEWRAKQMPSNEVILAELGIKTEPTTEPTTEPITEEKRCIESPVSPTMDDMPELMARF
jgi:hypothetical protein